MSEQNQPIPLYRKKRKKKIPTQAIVKIALTLVIILGFCGYVVVYRYIPNFETDSVYENIENLQENQVNTVLKDKVLPLENKPIIKDGQVYLPADFVKDFFDPYIFWEPLANKLTFTTQNKVIAMKTEDLNYYVNNEPMQLDLPVYREGDMAYIPESFIYQMYNVDMLYSQQPYDIITIDKKDEPKTLSEIIKKTNLRFEPNIKSPIAQKLVPGDKVVVFEEADAFTRVRLLNGLLGYVLSKALGDRTVVPPVLKEEPVEEAPIPKIEGKVVLLWDQVFNPTMSASSEKQEPVPGINVLSPTWFSFDEEKLKTDIEHVSDIVNIADIGYVEAAHANGYQVWALMSDNFNGAVNHEILSKPDNREHVIKQLLAYVSMYNLDGINIDFEAVSQADAPYYLQFLRELKPLLAQQGAVLSVDMFVPTYTKYYNRTEVAKTVDYVCVMTYDEHWSGSENTGPVASLGFVEEGIAATLEEVPKEKVLMGLPFYVRMWTETEDEDGVISFYKEDTTMQKAYNLFTQNGAKFKWLSDVGCYYAEFKTTEDEKDVVKKVWLEDERSIAEKLKIAQQYDLAGLACWKRDLEKEKVWDVVQDYKSAD